MSDKSRVDNEKSKAVPEEAIVALQAESELAQAAGSAWQLITEHAPQCGDVCWLWDGKTMWIGGRDMVDGEQWMWGNCYGHIWHNGEKWDGEIESDDDYRPTHWMSLPISPNEKDQL